MKRCIPLILLGLAACDAPLEEFWPRQNYTFEKDDRTYMVRVQSDPLDFTYYTRVTTPLYNLGEEDRDAVVALVENELGAKICKSGKMYLDDFLEWRLHNDDPVLLLKTIGTYQVVSKCEYTGLGDPDL